MSVGACACPRRLVPPLLDAARRFRGRLVNPPSARHARHFALGGVSPSGRTRPSACRSTSAPRTRAASPRTGRRLRRAASGAARSCSALAETAHSGSIASSSPSQFPADELLDPLVIRRRFRREAAGTKSFVCPWPWSALAISATRRQARCAGQSRAGADVLAVRPGAAGRDDDGRRPHEPERDHRAPVEGHRRGAGGDAPNVIPSAGKPSFCNSAMQSAASSGSPGPS